MISVSGIGLSFGTRKLFKDVSLKFTPGNCYGLIGANGAGKSTFLKMIAGEIDADEGEIAIPKNVRMAVLQQDQSAFDAFSVMQTVIMGHPTLYAVMVEREALYAKPEMTEEEGMRVAHLEADFGEMGGYEAESDASMLLSGLGLDEALHAGMMHDLEPTQRIRVLLAQALFGSPDILLLDEPTNNLDLESINWLEEFLINFDNTVIVVSHDRHFLNAVCTHTVDIDYGKIQMYVGNYDFWYQASQLAAQQRRDEQRKNEDKARDLKEFILRFSSNASKSRQATSRKKMLDKLDLEAFKTSTRRFPYVNFKPNRECGRNVLQVANLAVETDPGRTPLEVALSVNRGDKIAFVGPMNQAKSAFFDSLCGEQPTSSGSVEWGVTISFSYFPKENAVFFDSDLTILDWLRQFTTEQDETYVRGFLGRMLFSGEESLKSVAVLSGGEKVRCMLARMMLSGANALVMDEPTNHLDLEAITALNNALIEFPEVVLFNSHDHQFVSTVANRIIEFTPGGVIDRMARFDEYLESPEIRQLRDSLYHEHLRFQL